MKFFRKIFGLKQESERAAKIKRIFWFFFWGSCVPITVISSIIYFSGQSILQKQAVQTLTAFNQAKAEQLDLFIEKLKVRTADWSSDGKIRKEAELISQGEPLGGSLSFYLKEKKLPLDPSVALVDILDTRGIIISSSDPARLAHDESDERISFSKTLAASFGEAIFTPEIVVEEDELNGVPMLHFAAPLVSAETGSTVGVILLHVKNDELNNLLMVKEGKTLATYLVNREKLMITPSRFIPDAALKQSADTPPVRACLDRNKDYQGLHLNYRGEPVIGVSKCMSDGLGVIITEIDASEAFQTIIFFRNVVASAVAIILALALIFAYFSARKLLPQATTTTTTTTTTIIIIIIIIIIGVAFSLFFSKTIAQFVWRVKTDSVFDLTQGQARRHIENAGSFVAWQSEESQQKFRDFASELKTSLPPVAAVKIYNTDATLIWSDLAAIKDEIGKKQESEDVLEALSGEQKIESAEAEIQKQAGLPNLLEVYTPIILTDGGAPVGVAEIYFDTSDLVDFTRRMQFFIWSLIAMALLTIYLLLHVSFRKQNQQIARQARELSSIIDHSPHGIYTLNKDGIIDSFNPKMVEIAGAKDAKEVIGLNVFELPTYKAVGLDRFFREGLRGKSFTTEVEYTSFTGGKTTFRHYFGVPIFGIDGKTVERLLLMVEDISERKRLEEKLKKYTEGLETEVQKRTADLKSALEESKKLAAIVEESFESAMITDRGGVIQYVNPAWQKITGWTAAEVVKKQNPRILKSGKQGPEFYKALWQTILAGKQFQSEIVNKRKDGSLYDAEIVVFPIILPGGETLNAEIGRDITERKKSEAKIKELNELRNKFIQIVSHQLRTPLNSIRWNLESLLAEELGKLKKEQKEFLRVTHEANVEVIRRIHDLLTAMDIEEGRVSLSKQETSLESLWGSVMSEWKKKCVVKDITCEYQSPKTPLPAAEVDAEKIREAFGKLTENAVIYTPDKGKITATLKKTDGAVRFEISDTGIGIPKVEQPRIFTRFYRATNAPAMKPDASGLGLAISKYFVEQHGGKIGFESKENKGSTFWFEVPFKS
ncbi:MAG: hypothetical protein A3C90_03680 [Candidatus Magasanikbacteria bacterium RIFCSPHIGHO2_02_FULL_51_14]|uniref:histidine kinase n=1 Tax=Candidatus Magasanikbacteria bacterium RIFCSPHIGHO2_02_FULL_51_14 TaxID=1798683 RepID=A0A1F6MPB0_9BACT|nr:MAG: hypothetical protein A3C90_03680 [Candidatus Magasanikbacteria bacterium RIFCSPHIGHO2_02_FULL_51_14]